MTDEDGSGTNPKITDLPEPVRMHRFDLLPMQLWHASAEAARHAASNYTTDERYERIAASMALGTATEHLLMAVIADLDPALLADARHAASRVALSRANTIGRLDAHAVRTISYGEALTLIEQSQKTGIKEDVDFVMQTRNAAAHLALTNPNDMHDALIRLVRIVSALNELLPDNYTDDGYWGEHLRDLIVKLADAGTTEIQHSFTSKRLAAKARYEALINPLPEDQRAAFVAMLEAKPPTTVADRSDLIEYAVESKDCPACGSGGYIHWSLHPLEDYKEVFDFDKDGTPELAALTVSVQWRPYVFECPVCGLGFKPREVALMDGVESTIKEDSHTLSNEEFHEIMRDSLGVDDWTEWGR
jgi:hypothetical protein